MDLIIPDIVATSTEINSNEKLLYAYLKNSNKGKEYVSMTNREISDGFPLKPATISQSISNLERKGFIKRVIVRSEKNQVMERQIFTLV